MTRTTRGLARAAVAVVAASALTVACGTGAEPDPAPTAAASATASPDESEASTDGESQEGVRVDVTIADGEVSPQGGRVEVRVGEPVTVAVTSDVADEVHVHSDPDVTIDVAAGGSAEDTFRIDVPGQVAVESHELGVTIVQLVVRP